jgi:RNA polymerase sigma-70 factor (sigma-E family)
MDELAFSDYVAARRPQLFRTACFICGDPHRAEDIVQDALVRLYAAWDRVERMDNIDGYVRRIIVNAHLSDRRRPWRRERVAEPHEMPRDVPLEPDFGTEDAAMIRSAVMALPVGQRRVIVLRHIWNLTIGETAAELGISPGTVKSQSADAVATLRRTLAPSFGATRGQEEVR